MDKEIYHMPLPQYLRRAKSQQKRTLKLILTIVVIVLGLIALTWSYYATPTVKAGYEIHESQESFCDHLKHDHAPIDYKLSLEVERICQLN